MSRQDFIDGTIRHMVGVNFSWRKQAANTIIKDCGYRECEYQCWENKNWRRGRKVSMALREWAQGTEPPGPHPIYFALVHSEDRVALRQRPKAFGAAGVVLPIASGDDGAPVTDFVAAVTDHRALLGSGSGKGRPSRNLARPVPPWSRFGREMEAMARTWHRIMEDDDDFPEPGNSEGDFYRIAPYIEDIRRVLSDESHIYPFARRDSVLLGSLLRARLPWDDRYRVSGLGGFHTDPVSRTCDGCGGRWNQIRVDGGFKCRWCGRGVLTDNTGPMGEFTHVDDVAELLDDAKIPYVYSRDHNGIFLQGEENEGAYEFQTRVLVAIER